MSSCTGERPHLVLYLMLLQACDRHRFSRRLLTLLTSTVTATLRAAADAQNTQAETAAPKTCCASGPVLLQHRRALQTAKAILQCTFMQTQPKSPTLSTPIVAETDVPVPESSADCTACMAYTAPRLCSLLLQGHACMARQPGCCASPQEHEGRKPCHSEHGRRCGESRSAGGMHWCGSRPAPHLVERERHQRGNGSVARILRMHHTAVAVLIGGSEEE
jgi:hypothetical protein